VLLGVMGPVEEKEGSLQREGCFHLGPQPQKRGGNTGTTIQSQWEQLWRVSRRVNSFSSRHPMATYTIILQYPSYSNVARWLLGESNGYIPPLVESFLWRLGKTSKTASWMSTFGPIFLQSGGASPYRSLDSDGLSREDDRFHRRSQRSQRRSLQAE
jgi:hypothetical protein